MLRTWSEQEGARALVLRTHRRSGQAILDDRLDSGENVASEGPAVVVDR